MKPWRWLIVTVPAVLGLLVAVFLLVGRAGDRAFFFRIEADPLAILTGLVLSTMVAIALALERRVQRRHTETLLESMNQATEARQRFLRRLDHELKNPLTAVRTGLANLAVATLEEERRELLSGVEAQAVYLGRLVANLRKLADLELRPLERLPVDVRPRLQEVFDAMQELPTAQDRRLHLELPNAQLVAAVDRDLLSLAAYNLLDNAFKFTQPGDVIKLRAFENGTDIVIEVSDTGPGISQADLPHIWEELYRGEGARGKPGSGIGLPLVRTITERHGGRTEARSQIGQGAVFSLRFPMA